MKSIILIFALAAFCFSATTAKGTRGASQAGGYSPIKWNPNNQQLVDVLNFGIEQVVPQAIAAGQLAQGDWNWTKVNSVETQIVTGTNYSFNVYISNGEGATSLLEFVVNELENAMTLVSYNVNLM